MSNDHNPGGGGGGGAAYESGWNAHRLTQGCGVNFGFGLTSGVLGKMPLNLAVKVSFRVGRIGI